MMALVKCGECGKEVSQDAKACPSCGHVLRGAEPPGVLKSLVMFLGGLVVVALAWAALKADPNAEEKSKARHAIEYCWAQQKRPSLDPAAARLAAGACEMMEGAFRERFGIAP